VNLDQLAPKLIELDSGLKLIVIELPNLHRVVIDTHLRVGSRFETEANNGISHFLEHVMYRGTPSQPSAQELAVAFERLGGMLVATTATDSGSLTISTPPENRRAVLDLYAEVFQEPVLGGIEIERGIVREEILEGLDDDGQPIDPDNLIRAMVFRDHSLGLPITGTMDHLMRFDRSSLLAHHRRHYTGCNAVLGIAGPISADDVADDVERAFRKLERGLAPVLVAPPEQMDLRFAFVKHRASQTALRVAFRAPGVENSDEAAVDLLLRMIDDGMSTRLYRQVCDDKGLCYDVSAGYEAYQDSGVLEFRAESAHERTAAVLGEIFDIVTRLRDEGPEPAELQKAKQRHFWQLREMLDSPEALTSYFAMNELSGVVRSPLERQAELEALDERAVMDAAGRLFQRKNLSVVGVGMLARKEQEPLRRLVEQFS
jgi:predicted Zn-dependent peptidase